MTDPTPDIDQQVDAFREELESTAFLDPDRTRHDALELFRSLATAPTLAAAGRVIFDFAARFHDATQYRDAVVTAAASYYGTFIVFEASPLTLVGKDSHTAKLRGIAVACRVSGIQMGVLE